MKRVRNRNILIIMGCLLVLLPCGLTGCDSPTPQGFLWSGADGIAFLTWTNQHNQLSGTYSMATASGGQADGIALTGSQQNPDHVSLTTQIMTMDPSSMNATMQIIEIHGIITGEAMQTVDATTGNTLTWYAATSQQYDQLQEVYQVSVQLQYDMQMLQMQKLTPSPDSLPGFYQSALDQAQSQVRNEQSSLIIIQQEQDTMVRCRALEAFSLDYPPFDKDSMLQLPLWQLGDQSAQAVVDRTTLARSVALFLMHDQQFQPLSLPTVPNLPFPWKIDPTQLRQVQTQAQQQLATLKNAIFTVASRLSPLRAQAQQIQTQVAGLKQEHQCFE